MSALTNARKYVKWLLVPATIVIGAIVNAVVRSSVEATVREGKVNLSL